MRVHDIDLLCSELPGVHYILLQMIYSRSQGEVVYKMDTRSKTFVLVIMGLQSQT